MRKGDWVVLTLIIISVLYGISVSIYKLGFNQPRTVALTLQVRDGDNVGFWVDTNNNANLDLTLSGNGTFTFLRDMTFHSLIVDRSNGNITLNSSNTTIDLWGNFTIITPSEGDYTGNNSFADSQDKLGNYKLKASNP